MASTSLHTPLLSAWHHDGELSRSAPRLEARSATTPELPAELIGQVAAHLSVKDLMACRINKHWRDSVAIPLLGRLPKPNLGAPHAYRAWVHVEQRVVEARARGAQASFGSGTLGAMTFVVASFRALAYCGLFGDNPPVTGLGIPLMVATPFAACIVGAGLGATLPIWLCAAGARLANALQPPSAPPPLREADEPAKAVHERLALIRELNELLQAAVLAGSTARVRYLLELGVPASALQGTTALSLAINERCGRGPSLQSDDVMDDIIALLLEKGHRPRAADLTAAVEANDRGLVERLLESLPSREARRAVINENIAAIGQSAFHRSVFVVDTGIFQLLLDQGGDPRAKSRRGTNVAQLALERAHLAAMLGPAHHVIDMPG
jgi:hypothetical protein